MANTAGGIADRYHLRTCIRCGICDKVCPSGRNGGIHPDALIYRITDSDPSDGLTEMYAVSWKCLMCHRCSMNCPKGIDVASVIRTVRYDSASSGSGPKRFEKAAGTLVSEGRAFPVNGTANKKRAELGLNVIEEDAAAVNELKKIMERTGFRDE